jgi:hypothetical protein
MSCAILLLETASGEPTEFDGKYVKAYDPTYVDPVFGYDGGLLEVTDNLQEAMRFGDVSDAFKKYRQAYGLRPDGEPNRPLTAWTITVQTIPKEIKV